MAKTNTAIDAEDKQDGGDAPLIDLNEASIKKLLARAKKRGVITYDELNEAAASFTPEVVAHATGLEADHIRRLARDLAAADKACVYGRIGTTTAEFGTLASWLVDVLNVLTGNLDQPGGAMFTMPASGGSNTRGKPRGLLMRERDVGHRREYPWHGPVRAGRLRHGSPPPQERGERNGKRRDANVEAERLRPGQVQQRRDRGLADDEEFGKPPACLARARGRRGAVRNSGHRLHADCASRRRGATASKIRTRSAAIRSGANRVSLGRRRLARGRYRVTITRSGQRVPLATKRLAVKR